jgi:hypothetical protein
LTGRDQENDLMSQLSAGMRNRLAAGISRFAAVLALAAALSGC